MIFNISILLTQPLGRTVQLELSTFYPFLACMAESCHRNTRKPPHPALSHQVLNDVNPGSPVYRLPDGSSSRLLILGNELSQDSMRDPSSMEWYPAAGSLKGTSRLIKRILREGFALQICMAICTSLVAELYTTTSSARSREKRVRMRYNSAPLSDFGICVGSVNIRPQDKLAYWLPDGELFKGQDPTEHYWMYFTTVQGEEVILDCSLFSLNLRTMVPTNPYSGTFSMLPYVPAFFHCHTSRTAQIHKERRRISVLRNPKIHEAIRSTENGAFTPADAKRLCDVMEELSGQTCSDTQRELVLRWVVGCCAMVDDCLKGEEWRHFPERVRSRMEVDSEDEDEETQSEIKVQEWYSTTRKWRRELKSKKRHGHSSNHLRT